MNLRECRGPPMTEGWVVFYDLTDHCDIISCHGKWLAPLLTSSHQRCTWSSVGRRQYLILSTPKVLFRANRYGSTVLGVFTYRVLYISLSSMMGTYFRSPRLPANWESVKISLHTVVTSHPRDIWWTWHELKWDAESPCTRLFFRENI